MNQLYTAVGFDRTPRRVRFFRKLHVLRRMIGKANDPRMVVRFAARVSQLELFDSEHARAALREPICGAASDAAQP